MKFLTGYEASAKDFSYGLNSLELWVTDITDDTGTPPVGLSEEYAPPLHMGNHFESSIQAG
jgi:hypothetical protein